MLAGRINNSSKTEFLFIPSVSETKRIIDEHLASTGIEKFTTTQLYNGETTPKPKVFSEEQKLQFLIKAYPSLPETRPFRTWSNGLITATPEFFYLGTLIH